MYLPLTATVYANVCTDCLTVNNPIVLIITTALVELDLLRYVKLYAILLLCAEVDVYNDVPLKSILLIVIYKNDVLNIAI